MQTYREVPSTEKIRVSREKFVDRDDTIKSCSAGTAFPDEDVPSAGDLAPLYGQFCWRTDQRKLYQLLEGAAGGEWVERPYWAYYATATALRALDAHALVYDGAKAIVSGISAEGDTDPFIVVWSSSSSATGDNVNAFRPSTGAASSGNGRWLRTAPDQRVVYLADQAALRAKNWPAGARPNSVALRADYVSGDEGGQFDLDAADTSTADDAGLVIVDAAGNRYKRKTKPSVVVTPDMFGPMSGGSSSNTTRLNALQAAFNSGRPVRLRPGTWVITSNSLAVPAGARIEGPRTAIIQGATATGNLITVNGGDVRLEGFKLDGIHTTETYAGGFTANHRGIYIPGTNGAQIDDVVFEDLRITCFGEAGIDGRFCNRAEHIRNYIDRCGMFGILHLSPLDCDFDDNRVDNIYPGNTGTDPYRNAYGIALTNSGGSRVAENCQIRRNRVDRVPSWEGIDIHNGKSCAIKDNRISGCGQGIAYENHVDGVPGFRIDISGNQITGWSNASQVRDSQTYYKLGGIIANGADVDELGISLRISGNLIEEMGDSRTSGGGSGAIYVRNWRAVNVNDNVITSAYRQGIRFDHDGSSGGSLFVNCHNNMIDGVFTAESTTRGISASTRTLGHASGNFVNSLQTGSNYFVQDSTPTYTFTYETNMNDSN